MERIARAWIVDSAKCPPPSTPKESEKIKSKKTPKKIRSRQNRTHEKFLIARCFSMTWGISLLQDLSRPWSYSTIIIRQTCPVFSKKSKGFELAYIYIYI